MNRQSNRLFEEWKQHGKIIVSVDYDDTLRPWMYSTQEDCDNLIIFLKEVKRTGAYIVVFTASDDSRHDEIFKYCKTKGLDIDTINQNPISLPYGNQGKIFYNINLCDRSGLNEARETLSKAMYKYRGWKQSNPSREDIDF